MASVTPRKDKDGRIISYQIKVSRGRDITGKQLTPFSTTYTPPEGWSKKAIERDLQRVTGEFEAACKRGEVLTKGQVKEQAIQDAHKLTFGQYVDVYMKEKAASFAPGTMDNYKHVLSRASTVFSATRMEDIDHLSIKQYIGELQTEGKSQYNGKPFAYKTVIKHFVMIRAFFESAVENEVITANPMQNMKHPKPRKDDLQKEPIVYSEEQVQYIMECLNKEPLKWKALVMFAIDSGCRRGEIMGLKWEEIDFKTGKVNICRNAQYTPGKGTYISTPKSGKNRTIYINPPVLAILAQWKREQAVFLFGQGIPQSGFCFTNDEGEMMSPQAPTTYLSHFGKRYNLSGIHPHALRHSMATICLVNGGDIVSVSAKLGHADISTTLGTYAHANEEAQRRTNNVLADAIYK